MMTSVTIAAAVRAQLLQLARAALPREAVAALGGDHDGGVGTVRRVLPLPNVAIDDDTFAVDVVAFARAERSLAQSGDRWLGFVHSHPHGAASPSRHDLELLWPDCLQLIVAPHVDAIAAFVLHGGGARPLPIATIAEADSR